MKNKTHAVKNFIPKTMIEEVNDEEDEDEIEEGVASEFEDLSSSDDEDESLRRAFAKGELSKDGLNITLPFSKKFLVNNVTGMESKLHELSSPFATSEWIERLVLVNEPIAASCDLSDKYGDVDLKVTSDGVVKGCEREDQVQHDFKREMLFYRQAQAAVLQGIPKLKKMSIITKRPDDYFAQMVKTDDHMKKVSEKLNERRIQMEQSDKVKKIRMLKKLGKQTQVNVLQDRQKTKRDMEASVKDFQKGKSDTIDLGNGEVISRKEVSEIQKEMKISSGPSAKKNKSKQVNKDKAMRIAQKRKHKDKSFGYGGKKKGDKRNSASSFNGPMFGMRAKGKKPARSSVKAKNGPKGGGKKGSKKGAGKSNNRPGKSRRQNMRGKK